MSSLLKSSIFQLFLLIVSCWFLAWLILPPWKSRRYIPPKRRLNFNGLQGVISHKTKLFITTALRTSDSSTGCPKSLQPMGLLFIIYIICSTCSPRHSTRFLSRFTTCPHCAVCYWIPFRMSGIKLIRHLPLGPSLTTTKKHYLGPFIQC
jgi:phage shock protein PspC (stress-responsive transcriptional regulator)